MRANGCGGDRQIQVGRLDVGAGAEQAGALDHVAQLTHVAGPGVAQQRGARRVADGLVGEVRGQRQDVAGAVGQRRQRQLDRVEAVIEVFAERAVADHRRQVGVGGADHAHAHAALAVGAQTLELAGLQHAQQLHLAGQRQGADLVQEQRAAVGRLELAFARLVGAGVGAGIGAEQLGLDQLARQRAAVERDEGAMAHRGVGLHDLRDLLLAAAVGAGDQHRQVAARHLAGQRQHALAGRIVEHHAAQVVLLLQLRALQAVAGAAAVQFGARLRQLQQRIDRGQQAAVVPGLAHVVGRAGLDQLYRRFQVCPRGQQHHWQVGMACADLREQRLAFLAAGGVGGEVHVLDHQVHRLAFQQCEALFRRGRVQRADIVQREQHVQRRGHGRVVVDDQQSGHGGARSEWVERGVRNTRVRERGSVF